ncbi:tetratricopeptide repeat protein [bacterium]|nr:tetratricopeptide repeat protein [bacterium]
MMESGNDGQTPPISGPGPEEGADGSGAMPEVEGYEIAGPLGQGGMGTVWSAVQLSTRREVALKLLGKGAFGSEKDRTRFEREVELTARLHHPNIAQVFDSGVHRGVYYYAMELIDGVSLDTYVEGQQLTQRQILELMRTVCQAVQHAHERGVIHRDLKPSNILVSTDGQSHVLDFGLAKTFLEGDWVLTETTYGEAAGTPAYMSPEQAAGKLDQIDTRTDVCALGVILFRLLTGKSPHDLSGSRYEVIRRIAEEEVRRPREITKDVGRELEALLLKALARDPKDRYPSAGALAQDIENYLNGEPLTARPPTTAYFLRKRLRKYRLRVAVASSVLSVLIAVSVFAYVRVSQARDKLQKEVDKGTAVRNFMRRSFLYSHTWSAENQWSLDWAADAIQREFAGRPEVEAAARMAIGNAYLLLGRPSDAEHQFSRALQIRRRVLEGDHADIVESLEMLAIALWSAEEPERAEAIERQILEVRESTLGGNHPDTFASTCNLTFVLSRRGRFNEAAAMAYRSLAAQRGAMLEDSQDTINVMWVLVNALCRQGRPYVKETRDTVEMAKQVMGEGHHLTLNWMGALGLTLEEMGNLGHAEALRKEEVELRKDYQGEDDWRTLAAMNRYAALLEKKGKLDEVEDINRQLLERWRNTVGLEHINTLAAMSHLALVLEEKGKLAEAKALREEEIRIRRRLAERNRAGGQTAYDFLPSRTKPVPTPQSPNTLAFDDFDGGLTLDWKIAHPDPSHISLSKNSGTLTIATQSGDMHSHHTDYRNVLFIDCPVKAGGDFQLTTCLSSFSPEADWNKAGLICYNGDDDYLLFGLEWISFNGGPMFNVRAETGGAPAVVSIYAVDISEKLWLQVTKRRNRYTFSTSDDGKTFTSRDWPVNYVTGQFHRGMAWGDGSVQQVGLFAMNGSPSSAPEVDASFDFFEVRSLASEAQRGDEIASARQEQSSVKTR